MARRAQSVEPQVEEVVNGWLRKLGINYALKQSPINYDIDEALKKYQSKTGGTGGNLPDAKGLVETSNLEKIPVVIEYKGYKDKLVKENSHGDIDNLTSSHKPDTKAINDYAVNGAVHYANALIHHTTYEHIIAIGVTGHIDSFGKLDLDIGVYTVSVETMGIGKKVGDYSDLSFLSSDNIDDFLDVIAHMSLSDEERARIRDQREAEIKAQLIKLNNDIYTNEKGLSETARVHVVAAVIMATLGIPNSVSQLNLKELNSSTEYGQRDGDIIARKITSFLRAKDIPVDKADGIVSTLSTTLLTKNINDPAGDGTSQLKRIAYKIIDSIGYYYKVGLTTDFTGALFNEMYSWLGFSQDKLNDVVLTPTYVATLLARLTRIDKDSYVWDFATGSAGLLVAAMNEMLDDAKDTIDSPDKLYEKQAHIKAHQLLGIEILSDVYMLAILNMILMGDGSANLINTNSLTQYSGYYAYESNRDQKFPASSLVLNPPYSAEGNGMVFVDKALSMMDKGFGAVIVQGSAGSGKAKDFNRSILKHSTLIASIKMPIDLFVGKSNVQTYIYVFEAGKAHTADDTVRFIDFSDDGYARSNRRKSSTNLRDTGDAVSKYKELVDVVRYGKKKLSLIPSDCFFEGTIDPDNGSDWNQTAPIETKPSLADIEQTVTDHLVWEVTSQLKNHSISGDDESKT